MTVKDALNESSSFPAGSRSCGAGKLGRWQKAHLSVCPGRSCGSAALQRPISKGAPVSSSQSIDPISEQCLWKEIRPAGEVHIRCAQAFLEQNYSVYGMMWILGHLAAQSSIQGYVLLHLCSLCGSTGAAFFLFFQLVCMMHSIVGP